MCLHQCLTWKMCLQVLILSQCLCLLRSPITLWGGYILRPLFNLILLEVSATSNKVDYSSHETLSFLCFHHSTPSSVPSSHCLSVISVVFSPYVHPLHITVSQGSVLFPLSLGDSTPQLRKHSLTISLQSSAPLTIS